MPMLSDDKTGLLKAFLGSLPGQAAARLAMAVEVDRLMDGHVLPHDDILEGLRPVLRRDHYERTPTPLRLFCRPFQDLLTCRAAQGQAERRDRARHAGAGLELDFARPCCRAKPPQYVNETKAHGAGPQAWMPHEPAPRNSGRWSASALNQALATRSRTPGGAEDAGRCFCRGRCRAKWRCCCRRAKRSKSWSGRAAAAGAELQRAAGLAGARNL